ncbi:MAG: hypothetical protein OXC14_10290, partial [Rhodospirillaceae bacterium]|nr:hypothetical protein [Rhodospirillaceae bacterium]
MTLDTSPSGVNIAAGKPLEPALRVHTSLDLETVLLEGLSDAPASSSEDPGVADVRQLPEPPAAPGEVISAREGSVSDVQALLLDGLTDVSPVSSAVPDEPDRPEDAAPPDVPEDTVPKGIEPGAALDAGFESALLKDLTDVPAAPGEAKSGLEGSVSDIQALLLDGLAGVSPVSSTVPDEPDRPEDAASPAVPENIVPERVETAVGPDAGFKIALLEGFSDAPAAPGEAVSGLEGSVSDIQALLLDGLADVSPVLSVVPDEPDRSEDPARPAVPENIVPEGAVTAVGPDAGFEIALLEGISNTPSSSSEDPGVAEFSEFSEPITSPDEAVSAPEVSVSDIQALLLDGPSVASSASSAVPDPEIASGGAAPEPGFPARGIDTETEGAPGERAIDGPAAALAFAADLETEDALREGLLYIEGRTPDHDDPQVWPGGIRAAMEALAEGHSTQLVIVDIDGIPYPAGAIHELAEVCEIGTSVIAVGSDDTARVNREIMLAGVSDYLVKPVTAQTVRDAASRAIASERELRARGRVAGFVGTGGSGTTTVATAIALHAAEQGRYVSVLDLNRTVPAMALLLDVEPAPGLDQLFDVAGMTSPDPQTLDGVRAMRSERISVYAYRLGPSAPPVPSPPALNWLLRQLRHRSQLVLVDGLDDPELRFSFLAETDVRVLVAEPTAGGAVRTARILDLLGDGPPVLLVQNHTRAFKAGAGERLLLDSGVETPPDIVIPYEASLPE